VNGTKIFANVSNRGVAIRNQQSRIGSRSRIENSDSNSRKFQTGNMTLSVDLGSGLQPTEHGESGKDGVRGSEIFGQRFVNIRQSDHINQQRRKPGQAMATNRMPFGKHQGRLISGLPQSYLEWAAENIKGDVGTKLKEERQRRTESGSAASPIKEPKKAKKRDRAIPDDSGTHYPWTDRTGKVHMIPNDVDMDGRESEECPFDASVAVMESEPIGELDREFRAMFR